VAQLVQDALADPSASPSVSLLAFIEVTAVGHILLTKAQLDSHPELGVALYCWLPSPLCPHFKNKALRWAADKEGMKLVEQQGVELVFLSGHPSFYPRHDFRCAGDMAFSHHIQKIILKVGWCENFVLVRLKNMHQGR
jgi:putative acetyltransferase